MPEYRTFLPFLRRRFLANIWGWEGQGGSGRGKTRCADGRGREGGERARRSGKRQEKKGLIKIQLAASPSPPVPPVRPLLFLRPPHRPLGPQVSSLFPLPPSLSPFPPPFSPQPLFPPIKFDNLISPPGRARVGYEIGQGSLDFADMRVEIGKSASVKPFRGKCFCGFLWGNVLEMAGEEGKNKRGNSKSSIKGSRRGTTTEAGGKKKRSRGLLLSSSLKLIQKRSGWKLE